MTEDGDETRRRRSHRHRVATTASPAGAPPNSSDVLRQIFLRLPPLPSSLPCVSLVSKHWRSLTADPDFLLRFRAHHRKPPLLGLFKEYGGRVSFTPVLDAPDRIPRQRFSMRIDYGGDAENYPFHGTLLGCRHGRVLVLDPRRREVLVCDPITGEQLPVALPPEFRTLDLAKGAVFCADDDEGHVHGGCHSSPVKVVLLQFLYEAGEDYHGRRAGAHVYSSETGMWSNIISAAEICTSSLVDSQRPSTLVGGSLYWWFASPFDNMEILGFDIGSQSLAMIKGPTITDTKKLKDCIQIMQAEDSRLGLAVLSYPSLQMWDMRDDCGAEWVQRKTVHLELVSNMRATETAIVGYVEDDDAIIIKFNSNVFIVQLDSMQSRKLFDCFVRHQYHPFMSFYYSGEFGRCRGITSLPSTTTPAIQWTEQEVSNARARKKPKNAR